MNMKTVKVAEATNEQLDWLVAVCEGYKPQHCFGKVFVGGDYHEDSFEPSTNWAHIGPIIDREGVHLFQPVDSHFKPLSVWVASLPYNATSTLKRCSYGPTPLIAVARCYVASKLGDTAEVPEELN